MHVATVGDSSASRLVLISSRGWHGGYSQLSQESEVAHDVRDVSHNVRDVVHNARDIDLTFDVARLAYKRSAHDGQR